MRSLWSCWDKLAAFCLLSPPDHLRLKGTKEANPLIQSKHSKSSGSKPLIAGGGVGGTGPDLG